GPHSAKKEAANRPRHNHRHEQKNSTYRHEGFLSRGREDDRTSRSIPPPERFYEIGRKENPRPDGGKSPAVSGPPHRKRQRQVANVGPATQPQVISFENKPQRNGKQGHLYELPGRITQTRMSANGKNSRIGDEGISGPRDRGEKCGYRLYSPKHQPLSNGQRDQADPPISWEWPRTPSEKFGDHDGSGARE